MGLDDVTFARNMMNSVELKDEAILPTAVFSQKDDQWLPTVLSRGPWDPGAQHGGAPSALLAHLAESFAPDSEWRLARLNINLLKPVPVAPLTARHDITSSRSTTRIMIQLFAGDTLVAQADALFLRRDLIKLPPEITGMPSTRLLPHPYECSDRLQIPGIPAGISFYSIAMDHRQAQGSTAEPGPAAAWFRVDVPIIKDRVTSPAMRAAAAADFGSGVSWVLPLDRYLFANADLNIQLYREPEGEWIGLQSETHVHEAGAGITVSRLFDLYGLVGVASQTLVIRERPASQAR